jgi:hypothetical protein
MDTKQKQEVKDKFETWLETQSDEVKELVNQRFEALTNTVRATRDERDSISNTLKSLSKKVDTDSDAGKELNDLRTKLQQSERKASFIESAVKEGVTRPSVAYTVANAEGYFTEDGSPDWAKIRETVPELFKAKDIKANAGAGTKNSAVDNDPNEAFRQAAKNH